MTEDSKLLPCPFCNGDMRLMDVETPTSVGWKVSGSIPKCAGCGASLPEHNSEAEARAAWNRRATPVNASMGEDGATWTDEQHAAAIEALTSHKWLDPECHANGCQSLVWKRRYESAVKGRSDFRQAYREARSSTPRPTSELVAALRAIAWMPSAIDDRDGLEAFNEARRIARAALTQTSGVAASLPTAGVGVCEHDWQKNTNDLVMWVCSKCRLARPGEQPGFTKPQNTTPKAASVTDDMVDVAIRAYFGDEHRWHIGMSTEIQDEVRSGMRRALCSALTPIEGV